MRTRRMSCPTMKLSSPTRASAGPEMPIPLPGTAVGPDPPGFGSWGGRGVPGADVEAEGGRFPKNAFEMPRRGNAADSYSDRPETSNGAEARRASSSALVDAFAGATACVVAGARAAVGIADLLTERSPEDIGPVGSPAEGVEAGVDPAADAGGVVELGFADPVPAAGSLVSRACSIGATGAGRRDAPPPTNRFDRPLGGVAVAPTDEAGAPRPLGVPAGAVDEVD